MATEDPARGPVPGSTAPEKAPGVVAEAEHDDASGADDVAHIVGLNLRCLRTRRGLSLDRLAKASGVSRAMLGQIELGRSVPTISLLWKIARALDIPFAALMRAGATAGTTVLRADHAKILASHDGQFTSRALFPVDSERRVEFYLLKLAPNAAEHADPHAPGTVENLVVHQGTLEILVGGESHRLRSGDAILFEADVPHSYCNIGDGEALFYLVMTYADSIG